MSALAAVHDASQFAVVDPERAADLDQALDTALARTLEFEDSGDALYQAPASFAVVQPEILPAAGAPPSVSPSADAFAAMTTAIGDYLTKVTDTTTQPTLLASHCAGQSKPVE